LKDAHGRPLNFTVGSQNVKALLGFASDLDGRRRLKDSRAVLLIAITVVMAGHTAPVKAASFGSVRYDPGSDQLIVTMIYDGTNANHHFSIQWGPCRKLEQPDQPGHQIDVNILDDQWNDAATKTFTETVKVPLATVSCRPATVTLRTAPDFIASLDIPARP
jgi:hypothetical protein